MRAGWMTLGALAFATVAATPALAQKRAEFSVGGVTLELQLPAGSCLPQGQAVAIADLMAKADKGNVTLLTIVTCGDETFQQDYFAIKVPAGQQQMRIARPEFLKMLEPTFRKGSNTSAFAGATDKAADGISDVVGERVSMTGKIEPLGLDDACAYLGGILTMGVQGEEFVGVVAGCVTVIGDKPIVVYSAGRGDKPADLTRHVRLTRTLADSIRVKR